MGVLPSILKGITCGLHRKCFSLYFIDESFQTAQNTMFWHPHTLMSPRPLFGHSIYERAASNIQQKYMNFSHNLFFIIKTLWRFWNWQKDPILTTALGHGRREEMTPGQYAPSPNFKILYGGIDSTHWKNPKGERKTPSTQRPYSKFRVQKTPSISTPHSKFTSFRYHFVCKNAIGTTEIMLESISQKCSDQDQA